MTRAKFIISFFIFLSAFLFIGESYTFFLENFQESYQCVHYFLAPGDEPQELKRAIIEKSAEYDAPIFTMQKENGGAFSRTVILYGEETIWETLEKDWNIHEGVVSSFFSGKTTFIYKPFSDAPVGELTQYWYLGTIEQLYPMIYPGMERYSGGFANYPMQSASEKTVGVVWAIVALILLSLTYYDTVYSKKEQMVKAVLGANTATLIIRKIGTDIAAFSLAALSAAFLLRLFTNTLFRWEVSISAFLIFLIINALVLAFGMRIGRNLQIRNSTSSKKALSVSMGIKCFVAILTISILSVCLGLIVEGGKLYAQKGYYQEHSDSVHVKISYPYQYDKIEFANGEYEIAPLSTDNQVMDNFLRYAYKNLNASLAHYWPQTDIFPKWGNRFIIANLQGLYEYKSAFPEWEDMAAHEGVYILVPSGLDTEQVKTDIMSAPLGATGESLTGVFSYSTDLQVISEGWQDFEFGYTYKIHNPVILLDTYNYGALPLYPVSYNLQEVERGGGVIEKHAFNYLQFMNMDGRIEEVLAFSNVLGEVVDPNLMEFEITDISTWFDGLWALQNRGLLIAVIITLLVLVLQAQISNIVLQLEYEVNARELTVKKTMGYAAHERYRGMFFTIIGICIATFLCAVVVGGYFKITMLSYLSAGSAIVLILDLALFSFLIRRADRVQIQKVLKGGI
jgi:hypothetical protein